MPTFLATQFVGRVVRVNNPVRVERQVDIASAMNARQNGAFGCLCVVHRQGLSFGAYTILLRLCKILPHTCKKSLQHNRARCNRRDVSSNNAIRAWRERHGLRIEWIALEAGVSTRTAQYWESGERSPSVEQALKLDAQWPGLWRRLKEGANGQTR